MSGSRHAARTLVALCLLGLVGIAACSSGSDRDDAAVPTSTSTSTSPEATATVVPLPSLAGPKAQTAFDVIRALGIRPGSRDDLLVRDLLTVAEAQRAQIAVNGRVGALADLQRAAGYRLLGGQVELMSGLGSSSKFCLRAFRSNESPQQWFYDTDRVLPRGKFCT